MNRQEQDIENAKGIFTAHQESCDACRRVDITRTKQLIGLCWIGLKAFKHWKQLEVHHGKTRKTRNT